MYVNAWGQGAFLPLVIETAPQADGKVLKDADDKDLGARSFVGVGPVWGGSYIAAQFNIGGWSENIGWGMTVGLEEDAPWAGGSIWARPFGNDYLKITIGDIEDDTLRGKIGPSSPLNDFILQNGGGQDQIFSRFSGDKYDGNHAYYWGQSFMLSSQPIEDLFIGMIVNTEGNLTNAGGGLRANDAYRAMQIGAGYNIAGIGFARVQWIGGWFGTFDPSKEDYAKTVGRADFLPVDYDDDDNLILNQAAIQAAFNLTAVENLNLDVGFKYFLPITYKDSFTATQGMWLALGATYNLGEIDINFHTTAMFGAHNRTINKDLLKAADVKKDLSSEGITLDFRLTPSYTLDFGKVGFDFAYHMVTESKDYVLNNKGKYELKGMEDGWNQMGFGLWIEKGLGSGEIAAGISYTTPVFNKDGAQGSALIQIPVILTKSFF